MTGAVDVEVQVGSRIWFDGQGWEVAAIDGTTVRLLSNGSIRTIGIGQLLVSRIDPPDTEEPGKDDDRWTIPAVVLAGLSTRQQEALASRVVALREVLEPDVDDDRSVAERYASAAAQLGVTRRTLERQLARFRQFGPAGLVDTRMLRDVRRGVDPRWDAICVSVLASYTNRSNPTMQAVIDQTSRRFLSDHPDGVVPSRAVAYRRLEELGKGRYTFGPAKQRRAVAKRPTGVLGRLRADRPGQ